MPELNEVRRGRDTGNTLLHSKSGLVMKYIWAACEQCGKLRWVKYSVSDKKPISKFCRPCKGRAYTGKDNPNWVGGRSNQGGYIVVYVKRDDFFFPMAFQRSSKSAGCIPEHRLVMAKHMKRCLLPWEVVHHRNGIRDDNRLENLELLSANSKHNILINKEIHRLTKENKILRERLSKYNKEE